MVSSSVRTEVPPRVVETLPSVSSHQKEYFCKIKKINTENKRVRKVASALDSFFVFLTLTMLPASRPFVVAEAKTLLFCCSYCARLLLCTHSRCRAGRLKRRRGGSCEPSISTPLLLPLTHYSMAPFASVMQSVSFSPSPPPPRVLFSVFAAFSPAESGVASQVPSLNRLAEQGSAKEQCSPPVPQPYSFFLAFPQLSRVHTPVWIPAPPHPTLPCRTHDRCVYFAG